MQALDTVIGIDDLGMHGEFLGQLVGRIDVQLTIGLGVHRVGPLAVKPPRQELVTPVVGPTNRPLGILVERHEVGRIAQSLQRELLAHRVVVVLEARVDKRVIGRDPESAAAKHVLDVELQAVERGRFLVGRRGDAEVHDRVTRLARDDARGPVDTEPTVVGVEDVLPNAHRIRRGATCCDRRIPEGAGDWRLQIERRGIDLRDADVVGDLLLEVAERGIAALGVIPLKRQVEVLGLQWLQGRVALLPGATVDARQRVQGLPALDVTPTGSTDAFAIAGSGLDVLGDVDVEVEAGQ